MLQLVNIQDRLRIGVGPKMDEGVGFGARTAEDRWILWRVPLLELAASLVVRIGRGLWKAQRKGR